MTTLVERESTVSRAVRGKPTAPVQVQDSLLHRMITGTGVAIFYGVIVGVSAWNIYRVILRIFR
jgi:hypothetical protein